MTASLVSANIVIVANNFNPTIFDQAWLQKNQIIESSDYDWNRTIFAPGVRQINSVSQNFELLVLPDRLQLTLHKPVNQSQGIVTDKIGRIANALPETPYTAIGMNFLWHIEKDLQTQQSWMKETFFRDSKPLFKHFETPDARFGSYLSKDALGHRLKLEIKPVHIVRNAGERVEVIQYGFNFQLDISTENKSAQIVQSISQWSEALDTTTEIVSSTIGDLK